MPPGEACPDCWERHMADLNTWNGWPPDEPPQIDDSAYFDESDLAELFELHPTIDDRPETLAAEAAYREYQRLRDAADPTDAEIAAVSRGPEEAEPTAWLNRAAEGE
jgi:hypothetical protein